MQNVAADPDYEAIVAELCQQLVHELVSTGDPRLVDDGMFFETPPMAGPVRVAPKKEVHPGISWVR